MIIVQETDKAILDVLKIALEMEDFECITISSLDPDFLNLIDQKRPHVVMLDYLLSGDSSIQMCERIHTKYPHLPVIAISCNNNINEVYSKYGFDDYIKKPFDLDLLYAVLRKYIPK